MICAFGQVFAALKLQRGKVFGSFHLPPCDYSFLLEGEQPFRKLRPLKPGTSTLMSLMLPYASKQLKIYIVLY
jgi:hypothetical protein